MSKIVQTVVVGRFTVVEIETPEGVKAVGISRRSQGDKVRPEVGVTIATNRAEEAARKKSKRQKLNNQFMG